MPEVRPGFDAVANAAGFLDRSSQRRLRIAGPDRVKFLHNLTTNDVKRLSVGDGQETFITSPQGKTLGYAIVLACASEILLRTDPDGLAHVLPHFTKYGVFDDVAIDDVSGSTFEFHVAGPSAAQVLKSAGAEMPLERPLSHGETQLGSAAVRIVRESPSGYPGWTLIGKSDDSETVRTLLHERGVAEGLRDLSAEEFDALRIDAGTPVFGRDVTPENLPQEVGRDDRAISFVKGCYLGQETVARIDALGHVNRLLKGLSMDVDHPPPPGTVLEGADGKKVGTITSSAYVPARGGVRALAYVRTTHAAAGTELRLDGTSPERSAAAVVVDLPIHRA